MKIPKIHSILNRIERFAWNGLGKGSGSFSIEQEIDLLKDFLINPKLGVDIGGNVGEYSFYLRKNFPDMEIHIFEPSEVNQNKLKTRFKTDTNIYINNQALSDSKGAAELFSNESGSGLGSLTKRKLDHFNIDFNVHETIEMMRFEDYWESVLLSQNIDLAKMDVEGHELDVLKGFGKAIYKTKLIQFEFGGCNIDTRTYFQDFWYFFKEYSFKIYRITPYGVNLIPAYSEADEVFLTTNYLCVNQNFQ
ncbi:FkbM family methyltransferase [Mucilaginibacter sp.]